MGDVNSDFARGLIELNDEPELLKSDLVSSMLKHTEFQAH